MVDELPTEWELADTIESATKKAVTDLFKSHPRDHFYYLSLITVGDAFPPNLAAWSEEALEDAVKNEFDIEDARKGLKWSYSDSPGFCYGDEHFGDVRKLFAMRPGIDSIHSAAWEAEYELRLRAMETAMRNLDEQGLFGTGERRLNIVVNVEVMPPDYTNTQRAKRLNPPEAIRVWLEEAAEPDTP